MQVKIKINKLRNKENLTPKKANEKTTLILSNTNDFLHISQAIVMFPNVYAAMTLLQHIHGFP